MPQKHPLAFPSERLTPAQPGMALRDYFAIRMAPVLLNRGETPDAVDEVPKDCLAISDDWDSSVDLARRCYQLADAFVAVRGEQPEEE